MNQEQLAALLEEIGPERLLIVIQLLMQMSREQIQQLVQQLAQMVQGQQQGGGAPAEQTPDQGQQNMYG